jgi:hypothetical protein
MKKSRGAPESTRLTKIRGEQLAAARARLLAGELDDAAIHLDRAETVARFARLAGHSSRPPVFALTLITICAALVLAAWKVRLAAFSDLEVSIRAETTAVQLTLARPATFESFRGGGVDVDRLSALAAQISMVPDKSAGDRRVRVQGAPLEVRGLHSAGASRWAFALLPAVGGEPTLILSAYGREVAGELLVRPGSVVSAGASSGQPSSGTRLAGDVLDVISFGCDDCLDVPLHLELRGSDAFVLGNVPVGQLGFAVEQQADGVTYFISGLRTGSIRLLDADRTETIQTGDNLKLEIAHARRFQIGRTAKADVFSLVFEGTARSMSLGPFHAEKDLSPSVLEFFYRQKALALVWGAAVFLWGLFSGVRGLWQRKSS